MRTQRETYQAELQKKRVSADTFTRDRQVEAEADVAVLVESVRSGDLHLPGIQREARSFFLSKTRIIDEVARVEPPIVMRPEAALQWLMTLHESRPSNDQNLWMGLGEVT